MSDLVSLAGKTALVTGGAKRLGAAVARSLAAQGVHVAIQYRNSANEAEALAAELAESGVHSWTLHADFARADAAEELWEAARSRVGNVHILINSASIFPHATFHEVSPREVHENVEVNALAPLLLSRSFAMGPNAEAIVNFLDTMTFDYDKQHIAYHLSKRMFHALTQMMALEFAPRIRVNAIAPGLVLPPEGKDAAYLERLKNSNPLQRVGSPEGITAAVLFLLRSGFITGQTLFVDGGRHLRASIYG